MNDSSTSTQQPPQQPPQGSASFSQGVNANNSPASFNLAFPGQPSPSTPGAGPSSHSSVNPQFLFQNGNFQPPQQQGQSNGNGNGNVNASGGGFDQAALQARIALAQQMAQAGMQQHNQQEQKLNGVGQGHERKVSGSGSTGGGPSGPPAGGFNGDWAQLANANAGVGPAMQNAQASTREALMKQLQALQSSHAAATRNRLSSGSGLGQSPPAPSPGLTNNSQPSPLPNQSPLQADNIASQSPSSAFNPLLQGRQSSVSFEQARPGSSGGGSSGFAPATPSSATAPGPPMRSASGPLVPPMSADSPTATAGGPGTPARQPGSGLAGGAGTRPAQQMPDQRRQFLQSLVSWHKTHNIPPPQEIFNNERSGAIKMGDTWVEVVELFLTVLRMGGIDRVTKLPPDSPFWPGFLKAKGIPNPLPSPIPLPTSTEQAGGETTTDPARYLIRAYMVWLYGFEQHMNTSKMALAQRQQAKLGGGGKAGSAGTPPQASAPSPAPAHAPTPADSAPTPQQQQPPAPSPAQSQATAPAQSPMGMPMPPTPQHPHPQPPTPSTSFPPGGYPPNMPNHVQYPMGMPPHQFMQPMPGGPGQQAQGASGMPMPMPMPMPPHIPPPIKVDTHPSPSTSTRGGGTSTRGRGTGAKRGRKRKDTSNAVTPTTGGTGQRSAGTSRAATPATASAPSAPAPVVIPAPPVERPRTPKRARYKVEYRPLHLPQNHLAGWDERTVSLTFAKNNINQPTRSIHELAVVDMEGILMGLRSRLPRELGYCLTSLSMLSMGLPEENILGLPLAQITEIYAELLELLSEAAFGEDGYDSWSASAPTTDCDLNAMSFSELEQLGRDHDYGFDEHRKDATGGQTDIVLTCLNLLRNFSIMPDNCIVMSEHPELFELFAHLTDGRLCRLPRALRSDNDVDPSPSQHQPYSLYELARVRRDVLTILSNLGSHIKLRDASRSSTEQILSVVSSFLSSGFSMQAAKETLYGPPQPHDAAPTTRHSVNRAVEAFCKLSWSDANREVMSKCSTSHLVTIFSSMLKLLPVQRRHFDLLCTSEEYLGQTECLALSLYSLAFLAPLSTRAIMRNLPGAQAVLTRLVFDLPARGGEVRPNPFAVLVRRLVETLGILNGTSGIELDDSLSDMSFSAAVPDPTSKYGAGRGRGGNKKVVERGWLAEHEEKVMASMAMKGIDLPAFVELDSLWWAGSD